MSTGDLLIKTVCRVVNGIPFRLSLIYDIHNRDAIFTDGFLTYSDGTHDDVNKVLWSRLGWDPESDVGKIVVEYCRFFFGSGIAEEAATGIFALEKNWVGPVPGNKVIGETLDLWKKLEIENPRLNGNWR